MTVGEDVGFGYGARNLYGEFEFGEWAPDFDFTYYGAAAIEWYSSANFLAVYFFFEGTPILNTENITLEIDSQIFILEWNAETEEHELYGITENPFPAVGNPCSIKLKYTHKSIPFLYQFDLTADEYITDYIDYLGYDNSLYNFGTISPENDTIESLMWKFPNDPQENTLWLELFDYDLGSVIDSVFIDSTPIMSYLINHYYQTWIFSGLSNPFVDGETYNIRIYGKYEY